MAKDTSGRSAELLVTRSGVYPGIHCAGFFAFRTRILHRGNVTATEIVSPFSN